MATPTTLPATFVAGNVLTAAQMNNLRGAFRVLQVVSTAKTNTFTTSSSTFVDVTGLSVTITPSATSSKILLLAQVGVGGANTQSAGIWRINGGNASNYISDASGGAAVQSVFGGYWDVNLHNVNIGMPIIYLDSPSTTSATTYTVQARVHASGGGLTLWLNRSQNDSVARSVSSITALEISA